MSRVFIDTSAILALLVPSDEAHADARRIFALLKAREAPLLTTSYVLVETYALLVRRFGLSRAQEFRGDFAPLLETVWIGQELHERALDLLMNRQKSQLSLVDTASFIVIRDHRLEHVFAFDRHFRDEGLPLLK